MEGTNAIAYFAEASVTTKDVLWDRHQDVRNDVAGDDVAVDKLAVQGLKTDGF